MTMQAVVLTGYGNTDRLQLRSVPRPRPAPNEVLVRVRAIGVNDWDYNIAVTKFSPGDRVFGDLSSAGFGGFAEYVSPVDGALTLLPDSISFVDAAALRWLAAFVARIKTRCRFSSDPPRVTPSRQEIHFFP